MSGKEDKRVKNAELVSRVDKLEQMIENDIRIFAGKLEGKKRAALEGKVDELEGHVGAFTEELKEVRMHAVELEGKLANLHETIRQLVEASNASAVLSGCIERFLDGEFGEDWDQGVRKETERRAELLKKRKDLIRSSIHAKKMPDEQRDILARDLWEVATDLETRSADVAMVISLYLQGGRVNEALDAIEEIHKDEIQLAPEVARVVQQLIDRCAVIAKERSDEVQEARIERVPALVDANGRPISSG